MAKVRNWIWIGTIFNGFIAVFGALIAAGVSAFGIWGARYARTSVPNDDMALIPILMQALGAVFSALAPFIAVMAGVVFALSLISCFLGKVSLKKHQNLPYSRGNLRNTTGRILCNGILTLGFILMLLFLKFRSFLMIVIVLDQLVICALQVREIHEIRKLPHSA